MPATALRMGVKDPFNPRENIEGGAKFLKQLLDSYHDLPLALSAYNAGPGNVDPAEGVPHIPETMNYRAADPLRPAPRLVIMKACPWAACSSPWELFWLWVGLVVSFAGRLPIRLGRLPGDIHIEGRSGSFYFPPDHLHPAERGALVPHVDLPQVGHA